MNRRPRILIGGPTYDCRVQIEHAIHISDIVAQFARSGIDCTVKYCRASFVGYGRADLLTHAVNNQYDLLISIDSDTWWSPQNRVHMEEYQSMIALMIGASLVNVDPEALVSAMDMTDEDLKAIHGQTETAILSLAVACRDQRVNVWSEAGKRAPVDYFNKSSMRESYAAGLAYAFFNVNWYRNHRDLIRSFDMAVDGEAEDYGHCRKVWKAGGRVVAALAPTFHRPEGTGAILTCGVTSAPGVD